MATELPTTLTLTQAAKHLGLSVEVLTQMVNSGTLKGMITTTGEVRLLKKDVEAVITRDKFAKLKGKPITIKAAEEKYGIPNPTITRWIQRGYIAKLGNAYPTQIDEADIAYCAAVYKSRAGSSRIFNEQGEPYKLKLPDLAEYRRRKQSKN